MAFQFATYEQMTGASEHTPAYSCVAQGSGFFFAKKGAMVADQGNFKYEKVLIDPNANGNLIKGIMKQMGRKLAGENMPVMKVSGDGLCVLAWEAKNVKVIPMNPGDRIGVESENILAFSGNLNYGVRFIGSGVISQKGLFTTDLKNESNETGYAIIITDGNAIVMHSPCRVDPDAIICWTGNDPQMKIDVNWKTMLGQTSGESYMFSFPNAGQTVILQPSERQSGLHVGIDGGGQAQTQAGPGFGFGNQNQQGGFPQQGNQGQPYPNQGFPQQGQPNQGYGGNPQQGQWNPNQGNWNPNQGGWNNNR